MDIISPKPSHSAADVFISSASEDYEFAHQVFAYFEKHGIKCFFSDLSIDNSGQAEYKRVIDAALDACEHLVVVTSSTANAEKQWVRYEWDTFTVEKLSGRKTGNLITFVFGEINPALLPLTLRQNQVFKWPDQQKRVLSYVSSRTDLLEEPPRRQNAEQRPTSQPDSVATILSKPIDIPSSPEPVKQAGNRVQQQTGWSFARGLAWLSVYLWRPTGWQPSMSLIYQKPLRARLLGAFDIVLRLIRLWIIVLLSAGCVFSLGLLFDPSGYANDGAGLTLCMVCGFGLWLLKNY